MSGPKVIVFVTAQEYAALQAERDRLLLQLKASIENWRQSLTELGMLTEEKLSRKAEVLKSIERIYATKAFEKAGDRVRSEIYQLQLDVEQARIEKIAKELSQKRARRERLRASAKTVAIELNRVGSAIPADLKMVIDNIDGCTDEDVVRFQRIVNAALPSVFAKTDEDPQQSAVSQALLSCLTEGLAKPEQVSSVKAIDGMESNDPKQLRLDRLIAEIELIDEPGASEQFTQRLRAIERLKTSAQKDLLTDSLIVDLSTFCSERRERAKAARLLTDLKVELNAVSPGVTIVAQLLVDVDAALQRLPDLKSAQQLVTQARAALKREVSKNTAASKRNAVLEGFAALGYDIKEGMATAWAQNGRIVLSKKSSPTVGVEIGSAESAEEIQLRAVAVVPKGTQRNSANDREIEVAWCFELAKIREVLNAAGTQSQIEKALPAGSTPLKVYEQSWIAEEQQEEDQSSQVKKQFRLS